MTGNGEVSRITRGVRVTVATAYLAEQSDPAQDRFVWAYRIGIENTGAETVQLLRRTWRITDARGHVEHVHGPGVVGAQPVLGPGERFDYTSGTPLPTPSGFMVGTYHFIETGGGSAFDVAVPPFSLDSPHGGGPVH